MVEGTARGLVKTGNVSSTKRSNQLPGLSFGQRLMPTVPWSAWRVSATAGQDDSP